MGTHVDWREDGHQLSDHDLVVVLRFGTTEEHANVKAAIAAAGDYSDSFSSGPAAQPTRCRSC